MVLSHWFNGFRVKVIGGKNFNLRWIGPIDRIVAKKGSIG